MAAASIDAAHAKRLNGAAHVAAIDPSSPAAANCNGFTFEFTELRNSEKFVDWFGADLRYVTQWGKWLAWDGRRFVASDTLARKLAKATVRRIGDETKGDPDAEKWAVRSQSAKAINAILELAKSDPRIAIDHEQLDSDTMLLNVENGTIDLRSGILRPHSREDLITKLAPVKYDRDATCPTWESFLSHVMQNKKDLIDFLQRAIGYCLTGRTDEHALLFLYGGGRNGKSTFTKHVGALMGDYGTAGSSGLLFSSGDQHPTAIASLHGARFVVCPEVPKNQALNEARVKDLTGGDRVSARRMREDFWHYMPTHKLILYGNHKPIITGGDDGIWRRILLVPFLVKIKDDEIDREIDAKIAAEFSGILNWAISGLLAWLRDGLKAPAEVRAATDEYRKESDALEEFFSMRCVFDPEERSTRAEIRKAYDDFCEENGTRSNQKIDAKEFAKALRARGCSDASVRRDGKVKNGWAGVRLMTDSEMESKIPAPARANAPETREDAPTQASPASATMSLPKATMAVSGGFTPEPDAFDEEPDQPLKPDAFDRYIESKKGEGFFGGDDI